MNYEKAYKEALKRAKSFQTPELRDVSEYIFPELKESKEIKFRKFDIITNGKIEYEIKDIQKNQLGDWVYILYNDNVARLVSSNLHLSDGSIRRICEQVDEEFELKQRMEKQ